MESSPGLPQSSSKVSPARIPSTLPMEYPMKQSSTRSLLPIRLFLPQAPTAGFAAAALLAAAVAVAPLAARAQSAPATPDAAAAQTTPDSTAAPRPKPDISLTNQKPAKVKARKQDEKVVQSKASKKADKKDQKVVSMAGLDPKLPDKALYDKAQDAIKHGRYDVGRIDLQTLLNTYPESQYMMQAKLAIADSWFKEGGTAALTQAEQEYKDFITFFPNQPEAAEAQMRVGDIYFRQMDKPDRDYTKTTQAEQEYRLMLQQFPDSPLVPQARQRLREVQETLADREASIADFYGTHMNWSAVIARNQTVEDTYPLYSHMDDVLIGIGDAYEAMAHNLRLARNLPEDGKARLLKIYDDNAADAYRKVILEHSASAHVEDARDRLVGMNLPVPTPTPDQLAASAALENSRGQYTLSKRVTLLFLHQADTVPAATIGAPPLEDPKPTLAPQIETQFQNDVKYAFNPAAASPAPAPAATPAAGPADQSQAAAPPVTAAPLSLENIPTASASPNGASAVDTNVPVAAPATSSGGVGIEIVRPSGNSQAPATPGNTAFPGATPPSNAPPATTPAQPAAANPDNGGITAVGPPTNPQLAPIQHADQAPDPINEVKPGTQQPAQTASAAGGKNPKPAYDSALESSSKHKKKKGLGKLNPF